ncbi:transposase [Bradyrhizobium elkanii]
MNVRYRVELSQAERCELTAMLSKGKRAARKLKRAQILLAADAGRSDEEIARTMAVSGSTVCRTKLRFVEGNLERALSEEPRPGAQRKLTGKEEALLVATACASPPQGRARWTVELLADAMIKLTAHESLSGETVRRRLAENDLKPWRRDVWCIARIDGEYVACMEDVLDLYAKAPDPGRPVVCFDESPVQLIGEVRQPIPAEPGQLERYDCEYRRNGTVNLFVVLDVNQPWRKVKVTARRTAKDYAQCMRELVDVQKSGSCSLAGDGRLRLSVGTAAIRPSIKAEALCGHFQQSSYQIQEVICLSVYDSGRASTRALVAKSQIILRKQGNDRYGRT